VSGWPLTLRVKELFSLILHDYSSDPDKPLIFFSFVLGKEHNISEQPPEKVKMPGSLYNRDLLMSNNNNSSTINNNNVNSNNKGETYEIENLIKVS
jgi:hypothetical protein